MSASAFKIQVVEEDDEVFDEKKPKAQEKSETEIGEKPAKKTASKTRAVKAVKAVSKKPLKEISEVKKGKSISEKSDLINQDVQVEEENDTGPVLLTKNEEASTEDDISKPLINDTEPIKKPSFLNKITQAIGKKTNKEDIANKAEIVNNEISGASIVTDAKAPIAVNADGGRVKNLIAQLEEDREDKEEKELVNLENNNIHVGHSVKVYRKIVYFFIFLVIVLLGFISYYTFVKVKIILIPNQERISNNMIFDIRNQEADASENGNTIFGIVKKVEIETAKQFNSSGTEVIGKEVAGKVTIYNNYTKNQPLVASTRLLSLDEKLFRIKNTVNVPAGGSVEVEIYADVPGPESAVGPTKFSIPGLWAGLQDKIFAENKESIDYKQKVKKYIVPSDIEDAERELKQQLLTDAKAQINEKYKEYAEVIYKINENSVKSESDKKVNEEVDDFNMKMTAEVIVVAFNEEKTAGLAKQKFLSSLSENKDLIAFDDKNIVYSLSNYDLNTGSATVNAAFEGKVSVKDNFDIIEVNKIVGLNNSQLEIYLKNIKEIAGYEIQYTPSFLKRVPNLVDRIQVEIKK